MFALLIRQPKPEFFGPVLWFSLICFSDSGEQHEGAELVEAKDVRRRCHGDESPHHP